MAQTIQRNVIDDFERIVTQLVKEAGDYVASGEQDDDTENNIRRLRLYSNSLNAALNSVQFTPRLPPMPPIVDPPVMTQVSPGPVPAGMANQVTGAAGERR